MPDYGQKNNLESQRKLEIKGLFLNFIISFVFSSMAETRIELDEDTSNSRREYQPSLEKRDDSVELEDDDIEKNSLFYKLEKKRDPASVSYKYW